MTDLSYLDPPIEIAATSPRLDMIVSRMRSSGMRPYTAPALIDFDSADPLLVDIASVSRAVLERCARACMAGLKRPLVVLDIAETGLNLSDAITLRRDRDLGLLKGRLSARARREARNIEVSIRDETARAFGARPRATDPDTSPELIYLGEGSPLFLSVQGALKARGVMVTAALTRSTAREYLSQRRFAAALVDLTSPDAAESRFLDLSAPDDMLNGLPVFALVNPDRQMSETLQALLAHTEEIIECHGGITAMAARIETLSRRYLASSPVAPSASLTSRMSDLATGLFSRKFLEAHLERQFLVADQRVEPLSMMTLKLTGERRTDLITLKALADCVRPILRETDCPAVIALGTIGVSLPSTPYRGGVRLAGRIAARVAAHPALTDLSLNWRIVEKRAYHTPKTLLEAGLSGPFMRLEAA